MGRRSRKTQEEKPKWLKTPEELDSEEGWWILHRFKTKTQMAMWVNNSDNLADLEFRYPLHNYRRKLDIDRNYIAVLRK